MENSGLMIEIEIRRHGEWDYRKDMLTEEGKKHVKKLSQELQSFDYALSSTSNRAQQTAKLLSGLESITSEFLDEIPEISHEKTFNSETVIRQGKRALGFIIEKAIGHKRILVVTSGGLASAILFYLQGRKPSVPNELKSFRPLEGFKIKISFERL